MILIVPDPVHAQVAEHGDQVFPERRVQVFRRARRELARPDVVDHKTDGVLAEGGCRLLLLGGATREEGRAFSRAQRSVAVREVCGDFHRRRTS
jgi:hypothetical protein